jgi:queuine tRNA-ribosyltransferase
MEEARCLYVEQSRLCERLRADSTQDASCVNSDSFDQPLVVWDVGLGAAANAMAAIGCYEQMTACGPGFVRPMRIVSFENDLDSLKLAFLHNDLFPYLRHAGPAGILKGGQWQSKEYPGLSWELVLGDFLEEMGHAPAAPDVIFYDLFSSKTHGAHWTTGAFRALFGACDGRETELFTYTCSTAVRASLLAAGFYVARGRNAGEKLETTIALTPEAVRRSESTLQRALLGPEWLAKWHRSGAKFPADIQPEERGAFEQTILAHDQFRK